MYVIWVAHRNAKPKEKEENIERLVRRLVDGVSEDVIIDNDQRQDSINEQMMDVDMGQQATHLCGYSDVSSADTFPNTGQNTNGEISQGSEQPMEWHSDVNDPHLNCIEGEESMEWQEGGGPLDNVSVLESQKYNYGNKDRDGRRGTTAGR